ncbi:MAG: hypothetical protein WD771_07550 [Gemmatimonadaceae bacterium]
MRTVATLVAVALLASCAPKEPETAAGPTLADFAGTWQVSSMLTGTAAPVQSTMSGTADSSSWTMSLEGRPNIALQVSVVGDSLIGRTAEYESVLRPGVMVSVRTASAMSGGALAGTVTATYKTAAGEEVVNGTFTATKMM